MFPPNPMYETNAIQLHFYCGSFDIYNFGLARSVLFFVPVYIVKISTVIGSDLELVIIVNKMTSSVIITVTTSSRADNI